MKHMKYSDIEAEEVVGEAKNVTIRWLVSDRDGAENFAMRLFEVGPGGNTPYHTHEWEHEMFVLEGGGTVKTKEGQRRFEKGEFFFIAPNEEHQFVNDRDEVLRFLCLIPIQEKGC